VAKLHSEFERVVLPHLDAAYNLARWLVRDPVAAEDTVQEAMLRALQYHAGLRGDAKPWLLQIVRNVAYAVLAARSQAAKQMSDCDDPAWSSDPADTADTPEAALARDENRHHLDRSLAALPAELRECLVLREFEELTYKEIAQVTGVAIGTVMSRLWRARQALMAMAP